MNLLQDQIYKWLLQLTMYRKDNLAGRLRQFTTV